MPNIKSIINAHNKSIIKEPKEQNKTYNCINKELCPLNNQCLTTKIVYEATVTSNAPNYQPKTCIRICEGTFKKRFANHKKSFRYERYEKDTELSKEVWNLKHKNYDPNVTWKIKKKCGPFNETTGKCKLCINEKLIILEISNNTNSLNKRDELVSKCRHQNKFKLSSLLIKNSDVTSK